LPEAWNVLTGQQAFSFAGGRFEGCGGTWNLALSPDGTWLAQSALVPQVWDLENRTLLLRLPEQRFMPWCLAWSPNKDLLALGLPDGEVAIWNIPKLKAQLDELGLGW
jgi:WD40 repeat protein